MTKEQYLKEMADHKEAIKQFELGRDKIKEGYINSNKPCNVGDNVTITLDSGRQMTGDVLEFGILRDATVCITAVKSDNKNKYITVPHLEVKIN